MGAFLSGHFDRNKPKLNKKAELQNPTQTSKDLQNSKHHITCQKVSVLATRNKHFQEFLKKSHQSVHLLKLTDPCLDFSELSAQYNQLERNGRNLRTVKELEVGWWFDPDEVDEADLYGDEDDDDYWEEFEDDAPFAFVPKPYVPKKDVFCFLNKHLKEMKDLTRIKIDAVTELNKYTLALQANLKNLKKMREICINICEAEVSKKEILNLVKALKSARSIENLSLCFQWCNFPDDSICLLLKALPKFQSLKDLKLSFSCSLGLNQKSFEMIAKLPANLIGLENFSLNLKRQDVNNNHVKLLIQSLEKNKKLKQHTVNLEHCYQISFWMKLRVWQKKGFFVFNSPIDYY